MFHKTDDKDPCNRGQDLQLLIFFEHIFHCILCNFQVISFQYAATPIITCLIYQMSHTPQYAEMPVCYHSLNSIQKEMKYELEFICDIKQYTQALFTSSSLGISSCFEDSNQNL